MEERIEYGEFIRRAILTLRKEPYKGIHSVYSGFNTAFAKYYQFYRPDGRPDSDRIKEITSALQNEGRLVLKPVKGGVMLYLPEDITTPADKAEDILARMGLKCSSGASQHES